MKINKKMTALVAVVGIAGLLLGRGCAGGGEGAHGGHDHEGAVEENAAVKFWTCSMHPQIKQPGKGKCPLCAMDLIPVMETDEAAPTGLRELKLSAPARALAEVETAVVERRYPTAEIRMVGKVDYDETRLAYVTAWVAGRLDRLYVDYTGVQVQKGDHMVSIYSPELLAAQEELIQSVHAVKGMEGSNSSMIRERAAETVKASREKLRLWGLTEEQIRQIEEQESPDEHLTIYSPVSGTVIHKNPLEGDYVKTGTRIYTIADLSRVWVKLNAYESDLAWIHYGQGVSFTTESYPGEIFTGTIAFIDPVLNEKTRTVNVRVNVDNRERRLKPGMFVRATVKSNIASAGRIMQPALAGKMICPMHPEILRGEAGDCDICGMPLVSTEEFGYLPADTNPDDAPLVIPVTATLITGKRAVVYVETDEEGSMFEGREIVLGPRAGDVYIVRRGLREGERVVTRGAFKLDAELQINAKPSMMTPDGGGGGGGHNHGGASEAGAGKKSGEDPMQTMSLSSRTQSELHKVMAAADAVYTAVSAEDLGEMRFAFAELLDAVEAVTPELIQGHPALLWKEYAMLIGNDGQEGSEVNTLSEARQVTAQLREHMASMKNKLGLSHDAAHDAEPDPVVDPAFLSQLKPVLQGYLAIQDALANDDLAAAQASLEKINSVLKNIDMSLVVGEQHQKWMETSSSMNKALSQISGEKDMESFRTKFAGLSDTFIEIVQTFGAPETELFTLKCPMALDGKGAVWLQDHQETRNPYFGASMLGCGFVTDAFEAKNVDGAHHHE